MSLFYSEKKLSVRYFFCMYLVIIVCAVSVKQMILTASVTCICFSYNLYPFVKRYHNVAQVLLRWKAAHGWKRGRWPWEVRALWWFKALWNATDAAITIFSARSSRWWSKTVTGELELDDCHYIYLFHRKFNHLLVNKLCLGGFWGMSTVLGLVFASLCFYERDSTSPI